MTPQVREATARDQAAIVALVRSERLNPNDLDWPRFVVATSFDAVIGAVQMRRHADGSRELASLVVHPQWRGQGIAPRLIAQRLDAQAGPVNLITARPMAPFFERWGFRPIEARAAPPALRRQRCLGQWLGGAFSLLRGRRPRRLVILERA
jgi:amino-acid N-acetyltransferase